MPCWSWLCIPAGMLTSIPGPADVGTDGWQDEIKPKQAHPGVTCYSRKMLKEWTWDARDCWHWRKQPCLLSISVFQDEMLSGDDPVVLRHQDDGFPSFPLAFRFKFSSSYKSWTIFSWHSQLAETSSDSFMAPCLCLLPWNRNEEETEEIHSVNWFTRQEIPINHCSDISKGSGECSEFLWLSQQHDSNDQPRGSQCLSEIPFK